MKQFAIALDQVLNTLVWAQADCDPSRGGLRRVLSGFGRADETLSARAWRLRDHAHTWGRFERVLDWTFARLGDPDHCLTSFLAEFERHHLPPPYRTCSTPNPEGRLVRPSSFGEPPS